MRLCDNYKSFLFDESLIVSSVGKLFILFLISNPFIRRLSEQQTRCFFSLTTIFQDCQTHPQWQKLPIPSRKLPIPSRYDDDDDHEHALTRLPNLACLDFSHFVCEQHAKSGRSTCKSCNVSLWRLLLGVPFHLDSKIPTRSFYDFLLHRLVSPTTKCECASWFPKDTLVFATSTMTRFRIITWDASKSPPCFTPARSPQLNSFGSM